jgi:large subunit ribosomal protein L21
MYAIALTGGKQYKVSKDDVISVEKVNAEEGSKISLPVLMISDEGKVLTGDAVKGASVEAEVIKTARGNKLRIYKYKAKKNVRKTQGHRQPYSLIKIVSINY